MSYRGGKSRRLWSCDVLLRETCSQYMLQKPLPQPRRPHDAVASEVRRAVAKCKREGKKAVLICAGTFLGANCSTRGSKTDTTLMGILGDVSHAFVDLYPLGVTKVAEFDAAGGRAMCQASASAPATFSAPCCPPLYLASLCRKLLHEPQFPHLLRLFFRCSTIHQLMSIFEV